MNTVVSVTGSKDLAATDGMGTLVGQMGPDPLAQARGPVGHAAASAHAQNVQNNYRSPAVGNCSDNLRSWDCANSSETNPSSSLNFENRWRWPVSYRSVEVLAVIIDILIILSAGVLADTVHRLATTEFANEMTKYAAVAAVVAALFTSLLKGRGLYKPMVLLVWTSQVRAVTLTWIGVFMFLAGCVFALRIGSTFSRGTIMSFAAIGLFGLVAHRTLWRRALKRGWRAEHALAPRSSSSAKIRQPLTFSDSSCGTASGYNVILSSLRTIRIP